MKRMLDRKELSERLSIMKILSKSKTKFFMIIILSLLIPRLPSAALLDRVLREKIHPAMIKIAECTLLQSSRPGIRGTTKCISWAATKESPS